MLHRSGCGEGLAFEEGCWCFVWMPHLGYQCEGPSKQQICIYIYIYICDGTVSLVPSMLCIIWKVLGNILTTKHDSYLLPAHILHINWNGKVLRHHSTLYFSISGTSSLILTNGLMRPQSLVFRQLFHNWTELFWLTGDWSKGHKSHNSQITKRGINISILRSKNNLVV